MVKLPLQATKVPKLKSLELITKGKENKSFPSLLSGVLNYLKDKLEPKVYPKRDIQIMPSSYRTPEPAPTPFTKNRDERLFPEESAPRESIPIPTTPFIYPGGGAKFIPLKPTEDSVELPGPSVHLSSLVKPRKQKIIQSAIKNTKQLKDHSLIASKISKHYLTN